MYVEDSQILSDIAAVLKQPDSATLTGKGGAFWPGIVALRHPTTYNDIFQALAARGYTSDQITAWDAGATYERVLTVYWALVDNGCLSEAGAAFISKAESYLKSLKHVVVTVAGKVVSPEGTSGQAGYGGFNTSQDMFQPIDPCDPRLGRPTRF